MNTLTPDPQLPKVQSSANPPSSHRTPVLVSIIATILLASIGLTIYQLKQQSMRQDLSLISPTPTQQILKPTKSFTPIVQEITPYYNIPANLQAYVKNEDGYAFQYPMKWRLSGTVFDDENGNKVAELSPGHLTLSNILSCDEYFDRAINGGPNLVAKETNLSFDGPGIPATVIERDTVQIGSLVWNYYVTKVSPEGYEGNDPNWKGVWYPSDYCTQVNNRLFSITFYPWSLPPKKQELEIRSQILSSFRFLVQNDEKLLIDSWLEQNNLNQYGDRRDTMYAGGTPLFDERTGERTDRYDYILKKYPSRPWSQ